MPFVDKTYGQCVRPPPGADHQLDMLLCLRAAHAAFAELDADWRNMDATLVDQIIATNRHAIAGCLLRAEGTLTEEKHGKDGSLDG